MLANLPVTLIVKQLELIDVVEKMKQEVPAGQPQPKPRVFEQRVVRAEIEIQTQPGVPAIGFNYRGQRLESALLDSLETPLHHSRVQPAPGVSQVAYQISREPQPDTMLSTTMLIPLPDADAARAVMEQLDAIRQQPIERMIDRDHADGQLKLGLFHLNETSKGAYTGWFVFAPPRKTSGPPLPPASLADQAPATPSSPPSTEIRNAN